MSVYQKILSLPLYNRFYRVGPTPECLLKKFSTKITSKLRDSSGNEQAKLKLSLVNDSFLQKFGINACYLKEYPEIMHGRPDVISRNVKLMRDVGLDEDAVVEMLVKDPGLVAKCYKTCKSDLKRHPHHRIQYLSKELTISQKELCSALKKYKFVLSLSFQRIMTVMDVLKAYKIQPHAIFRDFWIIRCKAENIAERLRQVESAEVDCVRPWMARCKPATFTNFMSRVSTKQKLLGELSLEEYISQRLGYTVTEIKEIIDREPQLQKTSVLKIKKILDFLFSSGFSSNDIVSGLPRVANRNIDTIHSRLQELNQFGIPPSLYVVCKSKREYQHYVSKRKNRNK